MLDTDTKQDSDVVTSVLEEIQLAVEAAFKANKSLMTLELTVNELPSLREALDQGGIQVIETMLTIGQHNAASSPPGIPWPYMVICEENREGLQKTLVIVRRPGMLDAVVNGLAERVSRIARNFDVDEWFEVQLEQLDVFRIYENNYVRDIYRKAVFEQLVETLRRQRIQFHDTVTKIDPRSTYQAIRRG